jgi:hypothetical protein
MPFKMKGSALYGHGTPTSAMKQKTAKEELKELNKTQQDFITKKKNQALVKKQNFSNKVNDKMNYSIDSINNVNKNYKTQQQKDYESLSVAAYNKKYPKKD